MNKLRILIVGLIVAALVSYFLFDLDQYLTLEYVQSSLADIRAFKDENFALAATSYFVAYVVITGLSIPAAIIVTLMGGAIFGLFWGTLLASFGSSIGATLAFLATRFLLQDWVQHKFGDYLAPLNRGMKKDGNFYLFSIRLVPVLPFFVVNLLMGLTRIPALSFYLISQVGMLPSTAVFVNAGSELAQITSVTGLISLPLLASFVLLATFPFLAKIILARVQGNKIMKPFGKPAKFDANVVVIGAGSAGLVSSLIVAGAKAKVVLVEKHKMGGDCLNTGCVPSKALIRSGKIMSYIRRASEFGIDSAGGEVNFKQVMNRVQGIIKTIEPHDSVERFTSLGVECVQGEARIESPYIVSVGDRKIHTRSIIVASGARPLVPAIEGLENIDYLTSDNVWSLQQLPGKLLVVGGGPIGCELAQAFSNLGSDVTQVDMADRIMPREDAEVSELVSSRFQKQGIELLCDHKLLKFESIDGRNYMVAEHQGETVRVEFDKVLLAIGRKANVEGFGLEELGVAMTDRGTIKVNEYLQTNFPNIFACGDVAGPYQFTHMASFQAWFASLNAMTGGLWRSRVNYNVVPWATFTDPEVARVGLSEHEARQKGISYEITRYDLDDHDRALADGENHGFVKVLTAPGKDKILGVCIVGYHAGELIGEFVFAMTHGMGLKKISAVTHIYPTLMEANKFTANAWRSARLPEKYFPLAEKYFRWLRG
ncbi:MAG: FAD-dependent oxidoreductase [Gammaproteobacteria bacterium]|nr:FAD-dependent oxidoreductase [Gammaproteobacteria bacterium]MBT3858578.1 FAD-dependent oxidoreductase [Gammaproteobacteria bacterium]MBT3986684.1 FAD-dependent oxidoreductase [Gammaproteobacteria bacterium]MBT4582780.1 FAD-dependent oxidoreductase [Gammaproteobacteria bacterium]MBT4657503.1 FAD-dependent oxidoreductase [Gammaproteobacteria bacterium]